MIMRMLGLSAARAAPATIIMTIEATKAPMGRGLFFQVRMFLVSPVPGFISLLFSIVRGQCAGVLNAQRDQALIESFGPVVHRIVGIAPLPNSHIFERGGSKAFVSPRREQ